MLVEKLFFLSTQFLLNQIDVGSQEETFAREALFTRHPEMEDWNQPGKLISTSLFGLHF